MGEPPISRKLLIVPAILLIVAALYWGRPILMPLALATLLAFLLSPVVTALRRWGLGRVPAVLLVVVLLFSGLGAAAWVLTLQAASVIEDMPKYSQVIKRRLAELRPRRGDSAIDRARGAVDEVVGELEKNDHRPRAGEPRPTPVIVRDDGGGLLRRLPDVLGYVAMAGFVVILVIFMLIERQELRDRLIRLVGYGRITITTKALDDAAQRISGYLLTQAMVNAGAGTAFGLGLLVIGVPYALLWGVVLALARYVPYVGVWGALVLPTALSLAVSGGWLQPALVVALFIVLEMIVAIGIEPVLYSHRAGVSAVALLVAIGFWSWVWGAVGLILATPLTVCLVVLARYVPALDFVSVLIGDGTPLEPSVAYYQRLVARDQDEAADVVDERLDAPAPERVWDEIVIPALVHARRDVARGRLAREDERFIVAATRELVEDVAGRVVGESPGEPRRAAVTILGCPSRDEADATALTMLRQLVAPALGTLEIVPAGLLSAELVERVAALRPPVLCVASLPPGGIAHTRYLLKRLRACCPNSKILVGRWGAIEDTEEQRRVLLATGADDVGLTLMQTRDHLLALAHVLGTGQPPVAVGLHAASA